MPWGKRFVVDRRRLQDLIFCCHDDAPNATARRILNRRQNPRVLSASRAGPGPGMTSGAGVSTTGWVPPPGAEADADRTPTAASAAGDGGPYRAVRGGDIGVRVRCGYRWFRRPPEQDRGPRSGGSCAANSGRRRIVIIETECVIPCRAFQTASELSCSHFQWAASRAVRLSISLSGGLCGVCAAGFG
jgi:hypothetical protein